MGHVDDQNLTPAMRQYRHFKEQYADAILLFRMGDFYETFYEDARLCSQVLGIALTSRSKGDNPIPLAGIPYHALDSYLTKLIKGGYKVAICEQMEDASQAKGVVRRDVVRLVTAGTLTEDSLLEEGVGNYLAAIHFAPQRSGGRGQDDSVVGLAWVELSTGQFFAQSMAQRYLSDELVRLRPAECLVSEDAEVMGGKFIGQIKDVISAAVSRRPGWVFDIGQANETLKKHFGVVSLEGFGFADAEPGIVAAGAVLEYLNETQKTALGHITSLRRFNRDKFLQLDQATLRSLEVERTIRNNSVAGSLLDSLHETMTAMGTRKLRFWVCYPLNDMEHIIQRQDAIAELLQMDTLRGELRAVLKDVADIERITTRISTARATPRDLLGLAQTLRQMPKVRKLLEGCGSAQLARLARQCDGMDELANLIESAIMPEAGAAIGDGGVIRAGFDEQVDRLRSICYDGKSWLSQYQKQLIEQTGINSLKVGYNRVFGYYVEVSNMHREKVPGEFVRKQTIKNGERYITDELKRYENEALTAQGQLIELEEKIFQDVRCRIAAKVLHLQQIADAIATIDILAGLAHIARQRNYCRPEMRDDKGLEIIEGKHPVLDVSLADKFVPNDLSLGGDGGELAVITGPNMSGKSTYIRQNALLVLMAHMGSFIPAKSGRIGLTDRIFTRVGASDELTRGQSTFMVEMIETANIINNATERSLVILDEVGRGTSTYDGLSLAWAITEHIATQVKCCTLFATHYHELTELADMLGNIRNLNVAVREWKDEVVFLHKIVRGRADKSYGIHVAKLAGIPAKILNRSKEILEELENNFSREAHMPQLGGRLEKQNDDGQLLLFDNAPPDPLLEKLREIDIDNLTPMQAINLLGEIKKELADRANP